jgi:excisionase family DNA binding protein
MCDLMTYQELGDHLGIKVSTLYAWVHQKRIPHVRFSGRMVRFDRAEIETWLEEKKKEVK